MEVEQQFYWEIELYGGETIRVKPENVKAVQEKIASGQGAITTPTRSVIVKDIKDFRITDKTYTDQKLLEEQAQAFKEPIYTKIKEGDREYTAVAAKWVKKSVPRRRWDSYYRHFGTHKKLEENDSYVIMAFVLPVHSIDYGEVQDVTGEEYLKLERIKNRV